MHDCAGIMENLKYVEYIDDLSHERINDIMVYIDARIDHNLSQGNCAINCDDFSADTCLNTPLESLVEACGETGEAYEQCLKLFIQVVLVWRHDHWVYNKYSQGWTRQILENNFTSQALCFT